MLYPYRWGAIDEATAGDPAALAQRTPLPEHSRGVRCVVVEAGDGEGVGVLEGRSGESSRRGVFVFGRESVGAEYFTDWS